RWPKRFCVQDFALGNHSLFPLPQCRLPTDSLAHQPKNDCQRQECQDAASAPPWRHWRASYVRFYYKCGVSHHRNSEMTASMLPKIRPRSATNPNPPNRGVPPLRLSSPIINQNSKFKNSPAFRSLNWLVRAFAFLEPPQRYG